MSKARKVPYADLVALKAALAKVSAQVQQAISSEDDIKAAAAHNKIDLDNRKQLADILASAKAAADPRDLQMLGVIKEELDNVVSDIQMMAITAEKAKNDAAAVEILKKPADPAKHPDPGPGGDQITVGKVVEWGYDGAIQVGKFIVDLYLIPGGASVSDKTYAIIGAGLELLGMDLPKDNITRAIDAIKAQGQATEHKLDDALDALDKYREKEADAVRLQLQQVTDLIQSALPRFVKDSNRFLDALDNIVAKSKDKTNKDQYKGVIEVSKVVGSTLKGMNDAQTVAKSALPKAPVASWYELMAPLGFLVLDEQPYPTLGDVVVYLNGADNDAFLLGSGMNRAEIEKMAAGVQRLLDLDEAARRVADLSKQWNAAIDDGLGI
jgi:hypothetical protein